MERKRISNNICSRQYQKCGNSSKVRPGPSTEWKLLSTHRNSSKLSLYCDSVDSVQISTSPPLLSMFSPWFVFISHSKVMISRPRLVFSPKTIIFSPVPRLAQYKRGVYFGDSPVSILPRPWSSFFFPFLLSQLSQRRHPSRSRFPMFHRSLLVCFCF